MHDEVCLSYYLRPLYIYIAIHGPAIPLKCLKRKMYIHGVVCDQHIAHSTISLRWMLGLVLMLNTAQQL